MMRPFYSCLSVLIIIAIIPYGVSFDRGNIDGQHLRPPVLAILLETIERENFDRLFNTALYAELGVTSFFVNKLRNNITF